MARNCDFIRSLVLSRIAVPEDVAAYTHLSHGGGGASSSVRSAMFIATRAARPAKLRRSGMYSRSLPEVRRGQYNHSCRSYGAWPGIRGGLCYKYGAPNGAWPGSFAEDACKEQQERVNASCAMASIALLILTTHSV
jgi:hypothetical protein